LKVKSKELWGEARATLLFYGSRYNLALQTRGNDLNPVLQPCFSVSGMGRELGIDEYKNHRNCNILHDNIVCSSLNFHVETGEIVNLFLTMAVVQYSRAETEYRENICYSATDA